MKKKQIEFVDIVCLCKKCHDFIHLGRTQMLLKKREISQNYYIEVVKRGMKFLKENKLQRVFLSNYEINNPEWVLVYHGKIYSNRS